MHLGRVKTAKPEGILLFKDKFIQMIINNETTFGLGVAAGALGKKHPSGVWIPDSLLTNVNKVHVSTLPYDTKCIAQDIAGGIAETGCLPSCTDLNDPKYGKLLLKYLKGNCSGESRARIARLIEWLTIELVFLVVCMVAVLQIVQDC